MIIDGGKGQLSAAIEAMKELNAAGQTTLIGLAKNEEEIFFAGDKESLKLPYNSESLKIDPANHGMKCIGLGLHFHRNKRSKGTFKNELEDIQGIGKATADLLLKEFKSVKNIREKSMEELERLIGKAKAKIIYDYFQS